MTNRTMDPTSFSLDSISDSFFEGNFFSNGTKSFAEDSFIQWPPDIVDVFGDTYEAHPAETQAQQSSLSFSFNGCEARGDIPTSSDAYKNPRLNKVNTSHNNTNLQESNLDAVQSTLELALQSCGSSQTKLSQINMKLNPSLKSDTKLRACWRCKILRKKCDKEVPCKNCPVYDPAAKHDHWKVLGCHRGPLKILRCLSQNIAADAISSTNESSTDLIASSECIRSRRITFDEPYTDYIHKEFLDKLEYLLEVKPSILSTNMEPAYRLSDLFRFILKDKKCAKHPFAATQEALRLLSTLVNIMVELSQPGVFLRDYIGGMSVLPGKSSIFSDFLDSFQKKCSVRNYLYGENWKDGFYSLCLMSIIGSVLSNDLTAGGQLHEILGVSYKLESSSMTALYKTLVCIFCWASRYSDPWMRKNGTFHESSIISDEIMQYSKWDERGINSTREYLITLGTTIFKDGMFHGFLVAQNQWMKTLVPKRDIQSSYASHFSESFGLWGNMIEPGPEIISDKPLSKETLKPSTPTISRHCLSSSTQVDLTNDRNIFGNSILDSTSSSLLHIDEFQDSPIGARSSIPKPRLPESSISSRAILKPRSVLKNQQLRSSSNVKSPNDASNLQKTQSSIDMLVTATFQSEEVNNDYNVLCDDSSTRVKLSNSRSRDTIAEHNSPTNLLPRVHMYHQYFSVAVIRGHWADAENALFSLFSTLNHSANLDKAGPEIIENVQASILFSLRRQMFLELLEEKNTSQAVVLLQDKLKPLCRAPIIEDLNFLSSLLLCTSKEEFRAKVEWDGKEGLSRVKLLYEISKHIVPSVQISLPGSSIELCAEQGSIISTRSVAESFGSFAAGIGRWINSLSALSPFTKGSVVPENPRNIDTLIASRPPVVDLLLQDTNMTDVDIIASETDIDDLLGCYQSLTPSDFDYKYENGRRYHSYCEGQYLMPNDEKEQDRLDIMHHWFLQTLHGELFKAPISLYSSAKVLDIGSGTGIWAIDVARKFPNAEVIGIDLSPIQPTFIPPNLNFIIDDVESEWAWGASSFHFIHARYIGGSIKDFPKLLKQSYRALEPGGWIEFNEYEMRLQCDDGTLPESSAIKEWEKLLDQASKKAGRPLELAKSICENLEAAGYIYCRDNVYKCPVGSWARDKHLKSLGTFCKYFMLEGVEAISLALFTRILGWERGRIDDLLARVKAELSDRSIHAYLKTHFIYGRKPRL